MQNKNPSLRGFSQEDSYQIAREDGTGWITTTKVLAKICDDSSSFEHALWLAQEWDQTNEPPWGNDLKYQVTRLWNYVNCGEAQSFNNLPAKKLVRPEVLGYGLAETIVAKYGRGAGEKIRKASRPPPNAANALDFLFPNGKTWIAVSQYRQSDQYTTQREIIRGREALFAWLTPNPFGRKQVRSGGKWSMRCDANVLERSRLVVEFDLKIRNGWGPSIQKWQAAKLSALDVHGALFQWLAARTGLKPFMIVYSGSVSYHAWYDCHGLSEEKLAEFVQLTLPLGGDPASLTPSQLFRMPGGTRLRKINNSKQIKHVRQEVVFWNPKT